MDDNVKSYFSKERGVKMEEQREGVRHFKQDYLT